MGHYQARKDYMHPLYSVGYENITPADLKALSDRLGATVVDVRARMSRTKAGFGKLQLGSLLGSRYEWHGDILGGFGQDTTEGRKWLATFDRPAILLCKEWWPGDCHRHRTIAVPLLHSPLTGAEPRDTAHIWWAVDPADAIILMASDLGPDGEPITDEPSPTLTEYLASHPVTRKS
jgi:hypothetical protein